MKKDCTTCKHEVSSDCLECDKKTYSGWEPKISPMDQINTRRMILYIQNQMGTVLVDYLSALKDEKEFPIKYENELGHWEIDKVGQVFVKPKMAVESIELKFTIKPDGVGFDDEEEKLFTKEEVIQFGEDTGLYSRTEFANEWKSKLTYPQMKDKWFEEHGKIIKEVEDEEEVDENHPCRTCGTQQVCDGCDTQREYDKNLLTINYGTR